jgi:DNA polymerase-3 subunit alpha
VGEAAVRNIMEAREEGPFESLFDLTDRVDTRTVGKRALEALIAAGACDSFGYRSQLMAGLESAVGEAQLRQADRESGQGSLFDLGADAAPVREAPRLPDVPEWPEAERLTREKEVLGFFISGHPLEKFEEELQLFEGVNSATLAERRDQRIELPCVVTAVSRQISKRTGQEWARITVEDFHGTAMVLAFGEAWEDHKEVLVQDAVVLVRGQVSGKERDEEEPPVFLDDAIPLGDLLSTGTVALEVRLEPGESVDKVEAATPVLLESPGAAALYVVLEGREGNGGATGNGGGDEASRAVRFRSRSLKVSPSAELLAELRGLFGPDRVRLIRMQG